MAKLYNLKSTYELVNSLYGITPDPDIFEDIADDERYLAVIESLKTN